MDEPITTDAPVETGAVEAAQPVEPEQQTAAVEPTEPQTEPVAGPSPDDNLEWLKNKGVDPTDPEAVAKVAKMYRDAEKAMHQSTTKASELEQKLVGDVQTQPIDAANPDLVQQLAGEIQALKTAQNVNSFFASNPEAKALESKMTEMVTERPELGELVKSGYLSLNDLHAMAKASTPGLDDQLKAEGGREALQTVAAKQQAKAVHGAATSSELTPNTPEDAFLTGLRAS